MPERLPRMPSPPPPGLLLEEGREPVRGALNELHELMWSPPMVEHVIEKGLEGRHPFPLLLRGHVS